MARRKGASKSNDSDPGWKGRQKQNEAQIRNKLLSNEMNEASMSSTVSSQDGHTVSDIECQKSINKESSPPNIFNNSSSLKYLHKKFKRVASAVIEDNCEKVKTNSNANILTESSSKHVAPPFALSSSPSSSSSSSHSANGGEIPANAVQLHINESETNSQEFVAKCVRCRKKLDDRHQKFCNECNHLYASARFRSDVQPNEVANKQHVTSAITVAPVAMAGTLMCGLSTDVTRIPTVQTTYKPYDMDFVNSIRKHDYDNLIRIKTVSPLQQKTNKRQDYDTLGQDIRTRVIDLAGCVPHNFKENFNKGSQLDHSVQNLSNSSKTDNDGGAGNSGTSINHKTTQRCRRVRRNAPIKISRSANHEKKSANAQLPNQDADLDISQSTSSDLELSSCSTTNSSDVMSRSTTPPEESHGANLQHSALNYSSPSPGHAGSQSSSSLPVPERPYKPKFHKVFYQNNNNTNSISQVDDSKPTPLIKGKQGEVNIESTAISHPPLSTQSVEYLEKHISKIISQNEAIMEGVEPALQKKYLKITGIPRGGSSSNVNIVTENVPLTSTMPSVNNSKQSTDDMLLKVSAHESSSIETMKNSHRPFPTLQQQAQQALRKTNSTTTKNYSALNLSPDSQPLNLTNSARESNRKKSIGNESHCSSPVASTSTVSDGNAVPQNTFYENHHPQNPERSIIKSLLLNSRGLAVPTTGEGEDAVYTCPLCNISFRSADNLQYHTKCYCQGTPQVSLPLPSQVNGSPHSAPISPVGSPSHKYFRSNSFNLYRPEKYSPSTLAKLASSTLGHRRTPLSLAKLAAQQTAMMNKATANATSLYSAGASGSRSASETFKPSASSSSTPPSAFGSVAPEPQSVSSQCVQITKQLMDASLPSPGPLLGKTRLVDHYNVPRTGCSLKTKETANNFNKIEPMIVPSESALSLVDANKATSSKEPSNASDDFAGRNHKLLQMCGGEITMIEKIEEKIPRFGSSGGSIVSISISPDTLSENSPISMRTGLLSGGSIIETMPPKRKSSTTINSSSNQNVPQMLPNMSRINNSQGLLTNYFQFPPPINSITAFNPLTLPPKQPEFNADLPAAIEATKIIHGGKIIPFVPGIPGPNSLLSSAPLSPIVPSLSQEKCSDRLYSPSQNASLYASNSATLGPAFRSRNLSISSSVISKRVKTPDSPLKVANTKSQSSSENNDSLLVANHPLNLNVPQPHAWPSTSIRDANQTISEKPFNFMRIADNLSPPKIRIENAKGFANLEVSASNLDKLKPRPKLLAQVPEVSPLHINVETTVVQSSSSSSSLLSIRVNEPTSIDKIKVPSNDLDKNNVIPVKPPPKFLRPCNLPLKPGTFTPKKHHGITPTANTLPLISPETPRPSKHCVQLYLNGHAYTYLGLKCSTKTFYCTVNRPQPVYAVFAGRPELSMYSKWQTYAENNPHPLGFTAKEVMSMYDSRQRTHTNHQGSKYTTSNKLTLTCAPSDKTENTMKLLDSKDNIQSNTDDAPHVPNDSTDKALSSKSLDESLPKLDSIQVLSTVPGGYKSNEDYTYVRGRGRGRYVCNECGMRCIKPCTLKKHIRTVHSDVRPYTCQHCMFSFKTKGNLTKHMESKAHFKKCLEKGIDPQTPIEDGANVDEDRTATTATGQNMQQGAEDCDTVSDDSDADELEIDVESSDNEDAKSPHHEAAHCLLSLAQRATGGESTISPKSLVPRQPTTYPYVQSDLTTVSKVQSNTSEFTSIDSHNKSDAIISKIGLSPSNDANAASGCKTPTETKLKRINMNADVIDLSKPRTASSSSESKDSDSKPSTPTSYTNAAELLKSLMKLSDKVPVISQPSLEFNLAPVSSNGQPPNSTNNMLLQNYLTERALQKSKMKLSQVHTLNAFDEKTGHKFFKESGNPFFPMPSTKLDHIEISLKPRSVIIANLDKAWKDNKTPEPQHKIDQSPVEKMVINDEPMRDETEERKRKISENSVQPAVIENVVENNAVKIELHIAKPTVESHELPKGINDQSGMDTLAEIAANSVKLDASKSSDAASAVQKDAPSSTSQQPVNASGKPSPDSSAQNEQVSRKENSAKNIASEFLKLANEQDAIDDSSASSDSDTMAESGTKQIRRSSVMSLGSGQEVLLSARTVIVGEDGLKMKSPNTNDLPVVAIPRGSAINNAPRTNVAFIQEDGGPARCSLCPASFPKRHQLVLHMNIHYMNPERKYRCAQCGINFHTQGRLSKHLRSDTHSSKASMVETLGPSTSNNPRPFECVDCERAFRIHGHLAKHLRSKTHVQKLECLQKLQFGTYTLIEDNKIDLTKMDTTDCDISLASLKALDSIPKDLKPDEIRKLAEKFFELYSSGGGSGGGSGGVSSGSEKDQSTSDINTDKNTGLLIKKRKLNDGCKETLTISEGDDN